MLNICFFILGDIMPIGLEADVSKIRDMSDVIESSLRLVMSCSMLMICRLCMCFWL